MNLQEFENASDKIRVLEIRVSENAEESRLLKEALQKSTEMIVSLQLQLSKLYRRTFTTCVDCQTEFDLLTHHYSIGLHDNLVFVKCPKCRKDMAIDRIDGLKRE
ncbi:MAG: hypothetical protein HY200_00595 [Nitrospirae bacterium]|nr:hypothetical protein [Nitrospirota bacterium]MBI3593436.1 hypothetical protein [Nitrospirota bacterium]